MGLNKREIMNKKDMAKVQTCALRVSIHCEGCKHKVKKLLQKVEGVQKVIIDVEQGRVTVIGNVDPETLVNKLEKSGKHAELWESNNNNKGPIFKMNNQFNDFPVGNKKDSNNKAHPKVGKEMLMPNFQAMELNQPRKGSKDLNFLSKKDKKSVKFKLPEEDEFEGSDFDDSDNDEFVSERFDAGAVDARKSKKSNGTDGDIKSKKSSGTDGDVKSKKSSGIGKFLKAMLGKAADKKGNSDKKKSNDKAGKEKKRFSVLEDGEVETIKGGKIKIPQMPKTVDISQINGSWKNKKKGPKSNLDENPELVTKHEHEINGQVGPNHKQGTNNKNFGFSGQPGNFPGMLQGAPQFGAMNVNNGQPQYQGFDMGNFSHNNNPQHAQMMMMMMNQQRFNQNGYGPSMMHPMMGGSHPMMGYGLPQIGSDDRYTHMFNDENTDSCTIM